ncbi:methyltransferase [Candidatus Woesearchaeota archaeon]|nr:methyltransferase [Candidatus Woesearchaeota archaeon]
MEITISHEEIARCNKIAGIRFPEDIQVFTYNNAPLIADVRLKTTFVDGVRIDSPDNYFTFNPDGSRPHDVLFVFTPGEHVPDWDYSKNALLDAARNNPGNIFVDGGCGTGVKACLMGRKLDQESLDNSILLVDPNLRALYTTFMNIRQNEVDSLRYSFHNGTLRSALPGYDQTEIAGAYINPPYQARPEGLNLALHCDGGSDGLKITRELLEDLLPYLADEGTIAVHTKSPAYDNKSGFPVFPLILEDLIEGRILPEELMKDFSIRFSRACEPMDLFDFYRIVYRGKENDFARALADNYPLIDMTLMLITRKKGQKEIYVEEDPMPANPEEIGWGVENGELVSPGHVLWHRLFVPEDYRPTKEILGDRNE